MSSIGRISLDLNVNNRGFNRQVNGIQKQTTKAFNAMSIAVGNIIANMAAKAAASIGNFVKDSINKGSELQELQNVVDSVFTTMSDKVEEFSQKALSAYGLTEAQAKKMVGTYGAMAKSFGYAERQAFNLSTSLTGLTADVASFYNLNHDEAYTKLKSVFTGETESLKELGVVMTQAALDQFALANGFGKTTKAMTEQEKVALRFAFVQAKLATASGDFIRTQDQWANQTRILAGQFDSLKAALGQGFINILTPVIRMLNVLLAKLVQVANAFKSFTEMVMGKSSGGGPGKAMQDVADSAESAAASTGSIEDAASGAASAAKKAQKSLMGFDEINKLTSNNAGSGSGGGAGGFSFEEIEFSAPIEEEESAVGKVLEKIKARINELIELFKNGFKDGLGTDFENSIARMKSHLENIKRSLKDIFTDEGVVSAVNTMLNEVAFAFGQFTGALASIGVSFGEMLIGGFDKFLAQNGEFIKQRLIGVFDVTGEISTLVGNFAKAVAEIFEVFRGDSAKQIVADLLGIVTNVSLSALELSLNLSKDLANAIYQPIVDNKGKIKEALENTLEPISTVTTALKNVVTTALEEIMALYDTHISPFLQSIADGLSEIVGTALDMYNTHVAPVLDAFAEKMTEVLYSNAVPAIESFIEAVGSLVDALKDLWEGVLVPLINWLLENIIPVIAPIAKTVMELVGNVFKYIFDIVGAFFDVLGGLIDFISGVFTGDWKKAWNGIEKIFSGIWKAIKSIITVVWDTIVSIVKVSLQLIEGIIKTVFNAIKSLVSTVWNAIKNVITTVLSAIQSVVSTVFNAIKSVITTVVTNIKNGITSAFNSIKTTVTSVVNTISSTIKNVFNGIWNFLKGIINKILGGIESMVNGVIGGLNKMIEALNELSFDVPDWVPVIGGNTFGLSIPTIPTVSLPKLAEGGYVRANQPRPVIIGDNKTQGEIVAPENKMRDIMLEALSSFFSMLKNEGVGRNEATSEAGDIIIPIYLDGTLLDEVIVTAQQRRNIRSGGR